jgi:hypothetical protein
MSVVLINGLDLLAQKEASVFDLSAPLGLKYHQEGIRKFDTQDGIIAPPLLNNAIHRPHTMKVLGCKSEREAHKVIRRAPINATKGMYPPTGYARHQPKGLATLSQRPTNLPLMPDPSSFYAGSNSKLGQPKG